MMRFVRKRMDGEEIWTLDVSRRRGSGTCVETEWEQSTDPNHPEGESETRYFPSSYKAHLYAADLVQQMEAEGFARVAETSRTPDVEEENESPAGLWIPQRFGALFDDEAGTAVHLSGRNDIKNFYDGKTFPGCSMPPVHLLTLNLTQISAFPSEIRALGTIQIVYSNHESCDAWMMSGKDLDSEMHFDILTDGRIRPTESKRYGPAECEKYEGREGRVWGVYLLPVDSLFDRSELHVGGEPEWWQGDDWLDCRKCKKPMFFIASARAIRVPPDNGCGDQLINAFVCAGCRRTGIRMQMT